jgi:hypothetical protein
LVAAAASLSSDITVHNSAIGGLTMGSLSSLGLVACCALLGCGPTVGLEPVAVGRMPTAIPGVTLAAVQDERQDEAIGHGRYELLRIGYEVDADEELSPWLGSYLRVALQGQRHQPPLQRGAMDVVVHRFDIEEATWARGVADLGLRIRWADGGVSQRRMTVVTTELMADDAQRTWTAAAGRLAGWASEEAARWARAESLRRSPREL